jgi:hypothetical protein
LGSIGEVFADELPAMLAEQLPAADPALRRVLVYVLAGLEIPSLGAVVYRYADDSDTDVRIAVAHALGSSEGADARRALERLVVDPEPGVRFAAETALNARNGAR